MEKLTTFDSPWILIGLLGQSFFFSRFLVQWIASERKGRSTIPNTFWYLSIAGSALLLAYAIYRHGPGIHPGAIGQPVRLYAESGADQKEEGVARGLTDDRANEGDPV